MIKAWQEEPTFDLWIPIMELEDKLKKLARLDSAGRKGDAPTGVKDRLAEMLDGKITQNKFGEFVLVKKSFDPEELHRQVGLPRLWDINGRMLARVCSSKRRGRPEIRNLPFDPAQAAFFDCETTGLAGGVGTYAFLVAVGYLSGEEFVVEQYFMQDFHQERAVLSAVAERLGRFKFLVSYNGKCYDLPLLETRWSIHRVDYDSGQWTHVDLLYPCRRLWKKRIGDCSLGNIEREILSVSRKIDVPSYMIPQIYFDYLRSGEAEALVPVFHHNMYDILTLLRLTILIDGALEDLCPEGIQDPADLFSLGRIHRALGNLEASVKCFKQALSQTPPPDLRLEVCIHLGFLYKRSGSVDEAAQIWHKLVTGDLPFSLCAHEELAKYYEHKKKECERALTLVERAISCLSCDPSSSFSATWKRKLNSLEYRKSRLTRKIQRSSERAGTEERSGR